MASLSQKIGNLYKAATIKALLSPTQQEERMLKTGYLSVKEFVKNRPLRLFAGLATFPFKSPVCYVRATFKLPTLIREHKQEKANAVKLEIKHHAESTRKIRLSLNLKELPKSSNIAISPTNPGNRDFKAMWDSIYGTSPKSTAKTNQHEKVDFDAQLTC